MLVAVLMQAFQWDSATKMGVLGKQLSSVQLGGTRIPICFRLCSDIGKTTSSWRKNTVPRNLSTTLSWSGLSITLPLQTPRTRFNMKTRPKCTRNASRERSPGKPRCSIGRAPCNARPGHKRSSILMGGVSLNHLQGKKNLENLVQVL